MKRLSGSKPVPQGFLLAAAVALAGSLAAVATPAAIPTAPDDGWHSWRVKAVDQAPAWCCFAWNGGDASATHCQLDAGASHSWSPQKLARNPSHMQVYIKVVDGRPATIHAYSADCPVTADSEIARHGDVDAGDSARWLAGFITPRTELSAQALAAMAVHAGATARETLIRTAGTAAHKENRKDALFWMGQVAGQELFAEIRRIMLTDADPGVREHAAFSMSQSGAEKRASALRELGETDASAQVRGQAWFWLAQTGDPVAEEAILHSLSVETKRSVRDQAIFALAQLPDERGVDVLIGIVEDPGFSAQDRKRAIFWLAESGSARAMDYLARVLGS